MQKAFQQRQSDDVLQAHDRAIRMPELIRISGKSRTSIYEDIKAGTFPAGFLIGKRARAWSLNAINEWLQQQMGVKS